MPCIEFRKTTCLLATRNSALKNRAAFSASVKPANPPSADGRAHSARAANVPSGTPPRAVLSPLRDGRRSRSCAARRTSAPIRSQSAPIRAHESTAEDLE
eukprot:954816-Prymnesium_polylepis.2